MRSRSNSPNMAARNGDGSQNSVVHLDPLKGTVLRDSMGGERGKDLSRDDLVFLLSIMEGELQARDEVIAVLKAKKMDLALLEAQYGFVIPGEVLRALQRDSLTAQASEAQQQDVYEKPMAELDRLVETGNQSYRRMLEQLLQVERSHSCALCRLEEQDQQHRAFMQRSDDLTCLLEQDRERLKLLLIQEKTYCERKEEKSEIEVSALKEELTKLKYFALLVVDEQQRLTDQLSQQSKRVQELTDIVDHAQQELNSTHSRAKEGELNVIRLEAELLEQASHFRLNQEAMMAKLANEDTQNRQLRQQLAALSRQLDELEGTRSTLQRAEEELQELRDRLSHRGEGCATTPGLLSEVEQLRRRVVEMEGKDEELIRMGDQCRDLDRKLGRESSQSRSLKAEVDKLNDRISELDRLEEALGKSKQECSALKGSLEKERASTKQLSGELDTLKVRVMELEVIEGQLERSEGALRLDFAKLRTLTVVLVEERKNMAERFRQTEEKLQEKKDGKLQAERDSVSTATEKLIEESRKVLRSKAELEERIQSVVKERDELRVRLRAEEDRSGDLQSKVSAMKKRIQVLEVKDGEFCREVKSPLLDNTNHCYQQEENKVKELTQEVDRLSRRLMQKGVVEGELMKAEEDFESLERRWSKEQERARALTVELEESRKELSKYQLAEKEVKNQEHLLLRRLQEEQVKSVLLKREVEALKEKVQWLMGTEESICHMQMDSSTLQKRLTQQEVRNRELAREMEGLTHELDRYRRFSKSLRPGITGRRFSDLHLSTKEVQTEPADTLPPDYRSPAPLALSGKSYEVIDGEDPNQNEDLVLNKCNSPLLTSIESLNHQNNNVRRFSILSPNGKDNQHPINSKLLKGNFDQKGDVMLAHTPGQPLHIKVTPDHGLNTATLEISSPTADNATSYTSTAVIPTSGAPPKQRITIIQNAAISPVARTKSSPPPERFGSPDKALSPLTMTPISVKSPDYSRTVSPDHTGSPIQMVTVSTGSLESTEVIGQAMFHVSPERRNGWQLQRSNSTGPSVITTEDNKIHIHLGSPYIQSINGITQSQSGGPYHTPGQEPMTPVLTNGCHIKGGSKITSSITITPANTPVARPSQITVPEFLKPGPTRIPKPKATVRREGQTALLNTGQSKGQPPAAAMHSGKNTVNGQTVFNRRNAPTTF
ncbi:filamin A-interacting protein 1-like isoform X1 [Coregonus clupeaformis]|uniref:filamin A-interacting protein 1-like isoform X1 n=1 Tax=Coregonus clupeaformis TaxID=59861 RepID=UPI001BE12BF5|nr:filamin A-interacting protein 1-like isoform X1 [Coregonus clupeaformis]